MSYPDTTADAVRKVSHLWTADLGDPNTVLRGRPDPLVWNDAPLRWLVGPGPVSGDPPARGVRIGMSDVKRFRSTVDMFAELDDRFGGGHARPALIQYLSTDADRMLNGTYDDTVGRALFTAVGEATLLAAWMSYDIPVIATRGTCGSQLVWAAPYATWFPNSAPPNEARRPTVACILGARS